MLNNRNRVFNPYLNQYLSNVYSLFVDSLRAEQTTFSMGKNIIYFKTFTWPFYGQSCIKDVQGSKTVMSVTSLLIICTCLLLMQSL